MAVLVPSLKAVFAEVNANWPNRDHSTDGWIGDRKHCPGTSDHCADSSGRVHAIDIDKDWIDTRFVIERLAQYPRVIRYMNHNGLQYHIKNDFVGRPMTGDPHIGWIHVSIHHTDIARNYTGGYGIYGPSPIDIPGTIPGMPTTGEEIFDYSPHVTYIGDAFASTATQLTHYAGAFASLRL